MLLHCPAVLFQLHLELLQHLLGLFQAAPHGPAPHRLGLRRCAVVPAVPCVLSVLSVPCPDGALPD